MKVFKAVNGELSVAQRTLNIRGADLSILFRLVKLPANFRHTRRSAGFSFLGRWLVTCADIALVLVPGTLVAVRADLDHTPTGDRAGARWRSLQLHLGVVRLVLTVTPAVKQP